MKFLDTAIKILVFTNIILWGTMGVLYLTKQEIKKIEYHYTYITPSIDSAIRLRNDIITNRERYGGMRGFHKTYLYTNRRIDTLNILIGQYIEEFPQDHYTLYSINK